MHSSLFCIVSCLAASSSAGILTRREAKTPEKFCNVVFNTDACRKAGWSHVWDSLTSHGVSGFIAFTLQSLDKKDHYNENDGSPCPYTPELEAARYPIVMDPRDTDAAIEWLQSDHPPGYLELFNEPDFSCADATPLTPPAESAQNLTKLINSAPSTQLISPVPAYTGSDWLKEFDGNCTGCMDKIPIIGAHVYDVDPMGAIGQITDLHDKWPDKRIWVTELSPTTTGDNCDFDAAGEANWMKTVVTQIKALGYVEKIFWNTGTWGVLKGNPDVCQPSLTNEDGSPTALLSTYQEVCA
ncbi:MAG: hypothetical protein Q9181_007804 [Wetmoreana brouardii]